MTNEPSHCSHCMQGGVQGRAGGVVRQHSRLVEKQEDMQNHGETELCSETRIQLLSLVERCDTCKNKDAETFRGRGRERKRESERERGDWQ